MGLVKKSISVTEQQAAWIKAQLATGRYASDSEVIRSAISLKQTEMEEIEFLREKLRRARASGYSDMTPQEIMHEVKEELRAEGKLRA